MTLACVITTPLGVPVDPDGNRKCAGSTPSPVRSTSESAPRRPRPRPRGVVRPALLPSLRAIQALVEGAIEGDAGVVQLVGVAGHVQDEGPVSERGVPAELRRHPLI